MEIYEIVKKYLSENGYDGLCDPGICGCGLDNFMPCDTPSHSCVAAKKREVTQDDIDEYEGEDYKIGEMLYFP